MKRFSVITLGCKVNQCESAGLIRLLESQNYQIDESNNGNHLVVINTCMVTGKAAMQSRQAIRQAIRNNPDAKIVVTGCYAQIAPQELQKIAGINYIIGQADKLDIPDIIRQPATTLSPPIIISKNISKLGSFAALPSVAPEARTRAFLKIQDGCDTFCTYCIVPYARGRSRSMAVDDVLMHLDELSNKAFKEVVLTGIHLGAFGRDLKPETSLTDLLEKIIYTDRLLRIRLSSIEPTEITPQMIDRMAYAHSPLCPHFHIPLQSGDDMILKRMGRPYSREQFANVIGQIHNRLEYGAIGMDILVGFPGEDENAFNHTLTLVDSLPVSYLHVFPFSPRKGTPAAAFKDKVPEHVIKKRCKTLRKLGEEKRKHFYRTNIGREVDILIETNKNGEAYGISENYIPVFITGIKRPENTIVKAQIFKIENNLKVIGRLI